MRRVSNQEAEHVRNRQTIPLPRDRPYLLIAISDAGSVLVHTHSGSIDHLHRRVMADGAHSKSATSYRMIRSSRLGA
jgi:hypothetical protein